MDMKSKQSGYAEAQGNKHRKKKSKNMSAETNERQNRHGSSVGIKENNHDLNQPFKILT